MGIENEESANPLKQRHDKRAWIQMRPSKSKDLRKKRPRFRPNDMVKFLREDASNDGPFYIEKCGDDGRYTLCGENGESAADGREFEEHELALISDDIAKRKLET